MTFSGWYCWFLLFLPAYGDYYFINPPNTHSNDPESAYFDVSSRIVVAPGDDFDIHWSASDDDTSTVDLYLVDMDRDWNAPIQSNVLGSNVFWWTVGSKNTYDQYGQFYFLLTVAGNISETVSVSRSFNITAKSTTTSIFVSTSTTSTPTHASDTKSASSSVSPFSSSTSSPSTSASQASGQLSKGAKVGIGVAIPVAVIAGIAAGFSFARRSREKPIEELKTKQPELDPLEYQGQPSYIAVPTAELPDTSDVSYDPVELPGTSGVTAHKSSEMPGSTPSKDVS